MKKVNNNDSIGTLLGTVIFDSDGKINMPVTPEMAREQIETYEDTEDVDATFNQLLSLEGQEFEYTDEGTIGEEGTYYLRVTKGGGIEEIK